MVDLAAFKKCKEYSKWRNRLMRQLPIRIYKKLTKDDVVFSHYAGRKILSLEKTNDIIKRKIIAGHPFMLGRFGGNESGCIEWYYLNEILNNEETREQKQVLFSHLVHSAGFFPNDISLMEKFCEIYLNAAKDLDVFATWGLAVEPYVIKYLMSNESQLTIRKYIEPWWSANPWTVALAGKKVLLVHPFVESIRMQYGRRENIWQDKRLLPDFELLTFKAVQTIAGERDERFESWFAALDYMIDSVLKIDFDVAIVGCGAYGLPLSAAIKRSNRIAIHLGGATQLLFGIWGNRWDNSLEFIKLKNAYWIRPNPEETPKRAGEVEDGAYW